MKSKMPIYRERELLKQKIPSIVQFWNSLKKGDIKIKQQHEIYPFEYGDEYEGETGELCRIWFDDYMCIEIGYSNNYEYNEESAKPYEHYTSYICKNITDPDDKDYFRNLKWEYVYNKIMNEQ